MNDFYSHYRDFTPDPTVSLLANFDALVLLRKWVPGSRTRTAARNNFRNAMIEEFNSTYGTDARDLENWQNLCRVVRIDPMPASVTQCKKALKRTHVNLVDLIDRGPDGTGVVVVFPNLSMLRDYSRTTGKYFPKNPAKEGGILKALLRDMARGSSGDK